MDIICGYTDPIVGDVYCSDADEALDMADGTGGTAWSEFWGDGMPVVRVGPVRLEVVLA